MTKRTRAANVAALPAETSPDHRHLLASDGAAAALIASTAPTPPTASGAPPADLDAALWALRSRYLAAQRAQAAESTPRTPAEQAIVDAAPRIPTFGSRKEIAKAMAARKAALEGLSRRKPSLASEARFTAALAVECRVVDAIAATPARTLAGLAFKAKIARAEDYAGPELLRSIMDDIAAFAAAHPTLRL